MCASSSMPPILKPPPARAVVGVGPLPSLQLYSAAQLRRRMKPSLLGALSTIIHALLVAHPWCRVVTHGGRRPPPPSMLRMVSGLTAATSVAQAATATSALFANIIMTAAAAPAARVTAITTAVLLGGAPLLRVTAAELAGTATEPEGHSGVPDSWKVAVQVWPCEFTMTLPEHELPPADTESPVMVEPSGKVALEPPSVEVPE